MTDNTPLTVLDAVRPPDGFAFTRGIWLTHDVSVSALNRYLLPALAGQTTDGGVAFRSAPSALPAEGLTIVAAQDRICSDSGACDRVRLIPVSGRRQHAKLAVLVYQRVQRTSRNRGTTGLLRTLVTSANLTRGGLLSNRELLLVDDAPRNGRSQYLFPAAVTAIKALASDLGDSGLRSVLRDLEADAKLWGPTSPATVPGLLHSLHKQPAKPFPVTAFGSRKAGEVLLVGPAFAADNSPVADALTRFLGPATNVHLVVGHDASGEVAVPHRLLADLRKRVASVVVYATERDPAIEGDRYLHAKAIICSYPDGPPRAMVGSANLTVEGLYGHNREVVVVTDWPRSITEHLAALSAQEVPPEQVVGTGAGAPRDPNMSGLPPLQVVLVPERDQHAGMAWIEGTFATDTLSTETTLVVVLDGQEYDFTRQDFRMPNGECQVFAVINGKRHPVIVTLQPMDDDFWLRAPSDSRPRPPDPLLALLRADLSRPRKDRSVPAPTKGGRTTAQDDGFTLPMDGRLLALAKYRHQLAGIDPHWLDQRLTEWLCQADSAQRRVAQLIIASVDPVASKPPLSEPVARALADTLAAAPWSAGGSYD